LFPAICRFNPEHARPTHARLRQEVPGQQGKPKQADAVREMMCACLHGFHPFAQPLHALHALAALPAANLTLPACGAACTTLKKHLSLRCTGRSAEPLS